MFLAKTHARLAIFFVFVVCIVAAAALKFSTATRAGEHSATKRSISLKEPLAFAEPVTARRAPENSRIVNIQDGREVQTANLPARLAAEGIDFSTAQPLALASDDLNNDGFPDLVCGYASEKGGFLLVYYGSPRAFAPKEPQDIADQIAFRFPEPFEGVDLIALDAAPDFIATGDFDRDGRIDILTAPLGGYSLDLASGSSEGFRTAKTVELPGQVTAFVSGEKTQPDTYGRPVVAINGSNGSQLLEFLGDTSIADQQPVALSLPDTASFITTGRLDEDRSEDLAVVAGGRLYIQHGNGTDPWPDGVHADAKAGKLEPVDLPFGVSSVSVSDFIWDRDERMELAVTDGDGTVNVLARGQLNTTPYSPAEALANRKRMFDARIGKLTAAEAVKPNLTDGWSVAETAPAAVGKALAGKTVVRGMLASAQNSYDILSVNSDSRNIEIDYKKTDEPTRAVASFSTPAAPVAVLPMRLNMHGHAGLVVLQKGQVEPTFMMFAPSATFTVNKTADTADGVCNADCSIREAITASDGSAGADAVTIPAGTFQLTRVGDDNTTSNGDLDVNSDITFTGAGAGTLIQGSSSATFIGNVGDKAFGINQDGSHTTLIATVINATVRFTRNDILVNGAFTQTGGATDVFLTGTGGSPGPTATFTNVTYDSNANSHSYGGALNIDSGDAAAVSTNIFRGTVQITGSTFSNNKTLGTAGGDNPPLGGGISMFADKHNVTVSSSTISGNQTPADVRGNGGGINLQHSFGGTVTFNSGTAITGNTSGSDGGGLAIGGLGGQTFSMTGGSISNNTALGTTDSGDGGGVLNGTPVLGSSFSGVTISNNIATAGTAGTGGGIKDLSGVLTTIDNCIITGNSADSGGGVATAGGSSQTGVTNSVLTGNTATTGGAFLVSAGTLNATLDYINGNTATGSGVAQTGGTANATNNWWGCDNLPNNAGCQTTSGTVTSSPRIDLVTTAATSPIPSGGTSLITASFASNSLGGPINPTVMNGRTVTFAATNGAMAPTSAAVASLTASSTYTNNGTCGSSTESATLDNGTQNVTVAVNCPAGISKSYNPTTVLQNNGTSTLTINLTNPNAGVALTGVGVVDTFPLGTQVAATPGATNTCGGTFAPVAGATSITLSGGSIAASGNCSIGVSVTGTTVGPKNNTTNNVTSTNGGNGLTGSATLTVTNTATWTGASSTAWATAANWNPSFAPAATNDVSIPAAGVTNEPTISTAVSIGNITESAGRTLTITAPASMTASGTCTINGTMSVAGTFSCGSFTGTGTVNFTGAVTQNVPSGSYQNLGVTNAAGINLTGSTTVNGTLTMNGGNINTGANVLTVGTGGSVTRTTGSIIGDIAKIFNANGAFTYPVGTATGFSPVNVNVTALTINPSTLQVKANDGTAPAVPALQDLTTLNRFWTLTRTGNLTANVTFNYLNGDVRGNEALYRTIVVRGTTAALIGNSGPCPGAGSVCVDPAANTITILGLTAFSNWTAGELAPNAADVNVSGRVLAPGGTGAPGAHVSIIDQQGRTLSAMTNPFGFFQFAGVRAGQSYTVSVKSKYGTYQPRFVTVNEELTDFNFFPVP